MTPLAQEVEVTANPVWTPKKAQHFLIISASDHTTNFQGDSENQVRVRACGRRWAENSESRILWFLKDGYTRVNSPPNNGPWWTQDSSLKRENQGK